MTNPPRSTRAVLIYEIWVREELQGRELRRWFDGMEATSQPAGGTRLRGPVADQAALHGLLTRVRDLGLTLVSVRQVEAEDGSG